MHLLASILAIFRIAENTLVEIENCITFDVITELKKKLY